MFVSCNALVEDEFPDFAAIPVMNGLLRADNTFRVQISLAANLSDTMPDFVDNALVVIEDQNKTIDTLTYTDEGWYVSPRIVKAGNSYTCRVDIPGFNTMMAQTTVPLPTEIDSIIFTDLASRGQEGEKVSSVAFRLRNNIETERFWEVKFKKRWFGLLYDWDLENRVEKSQVDEAYIFMQAEQDSVLLSEANPLTVFCNREMKSERHWIKFYFSESYFSFGRTDTLFIELQNIDESYYRYHKQYYIYESASWGGLGSSPQRYPLYSNVTNGLGIFTGMSVTKKNLFSE
ncbi:MAG: DUF4249 domain-containing protein [Prolixibacteraceae bacterium]|nr:DUF4249 domain-containing protein [Prolixibacteraceae bacterium]